jgi:hypothetical protein
VKKKKRNETVVIHPEIKKEKKSESAGYEPWASLKE